MGTVVEHYRVRLSRSVCYTAARGEGRGLLEWSVIHCYMRTRRVVRGSKVDVIELGSCVVVLLAILVYRYIVRLISVFTSLYFHPGNCAKSYIIIIIV